MSYWRFGAMIATSVVVMFGIKYLSTYEWSHVWYSETRTYMALMTGGAMGVIVLGFMLGMYRDRRINIAIFDHRVRELAEKIITAQRREICGDVVAHPRHR